MQRDLSFIYERYESMKVYQEFLDKCLLKAANNNQTNATAVYNILRKAGISNMKEFMEADLEALSLRRGCGMIRFAIIQKLRKMAEGWENKDDNTRID